MVELTQEQVASLELSGGYSQTIADTRLEAAQATAAIATAFPELDTEDLQSKLSRPLSSEQFQAAFEEFGNLVSEVNAIRLGELESGQRFEESPDTIRAQGQDALGKLSSRAQRSERFFGRVTREYVASVLHRRAEHGVSAAEAKEPADVPEEHARDDAVVAPAASDALAAEQRLEQYFETGKFSVHRGGNRQTLVDAAELLRAKGGGEAQAIIDELEATHGSVEDAPTGHIQQAVLEATEAYQKQKMAQWESAGVSPEDRLWKRADRDLGPTTFSELQREGSEALELPERATAAPEVPPEAAVGVDRLDGAEAQAILDEVFAGRSTQGLRSEDSRVAFVAAATLLAEGGGAEAAGIIDGIRAADASFSGVDDATLHRAVYDATHAFKAEFNAQMELTGQHSRSIRPDWIFNNRTRVLLSEMPERSPTERLLAFASRNPELTEQAEAFMEAAATVQEVGAVYYTHVATDATLKGARLASSKIAIDPEAQAALPGLEVAYEQELAASRATLEATQEDFDRANALFLQAADTFEDVIYRGGGSTESFDSAIASLAGLEPEEGRLAEAEDLHDQVVRTQAERLAILRDSGLAAIREHVGRVPLAGVREGLSFHTSEPDPLNSLLSGIHLGLSGGSPLDQGSTFEVSTAVDLSFMRNNLLDSTDYQYLQDEGLRLAVSAEAEGLYGGQSIFTDPQTAEFAFGPASAEGLYRALLTQVVSPELRNAMPAATVSTVADLPVS